MVQRIGRAESRARLRQARQPRACDKFSGRGRTRIEAAMNSRDGSGYTCRRHQRCQSE